MTLSSTRATIEWAPTVSIESIVDEVVIDVTPDRARLLDGLTRELLVAEPGSVHGAFEREADKRRFFRIYRLEARHAAEAKPYRSRDRGFS